jgi:hypothetical protein
MSERDFVSMVVRRAAWATFLAAALLAPAGARAQSAPSVAPSAVGAPTAAAAIQPGMEEGPLSDAREEISAVLKLVAPDGRLVLDRESWKASADEAEKAGAGGANVPNVAIGAAGAAGFRGSDLGRLIERIRAKAGANRRSMGSSGTSINGTFSGGNLSGAYTSDENLLDLILREQHAPGRMLLFRNDETGLVLQLVDTGGRAALFLVQDPNGGITITHLSGEEVLRAKVGSFRELCKDRRDYVETRLRPLMENAGVSLPITPWSAAVRSTILAILKSPPAKTAELLAQLDSDKVPEREAATRELSATFLVSYPLLKSALDKPAASPEVKARVQEVFLQNRAKMEAVALIYSMGLLRDAELLGDMLKSAGSEDRKALTAELEKITKDRK